jgi:hypothetical protein
MRKVAEPHCSEASDTAITKSRFAVTPNFAEAHP